MPRPVSHSPRTSPSPRRGGRGHDLHVPSGVLVSSTSLFTSAGVVTDLHFSMPSSFRRSSQYTTRTRTS
eukprot:8925128-Heterocapsa_arctica.AAC.1